MFASIQNYPLVAELVGEMFHDSMAHCGNDIVYSTDIICVALNWQVGLPAYAYWAALLNPRTKWSTLQVITEVKKRQIWVDINGAIVEMVELGWTEATVASEQSSVSVDVTVSPQQKKNKGAATVLVSSPDGGSATDGPLIVLFP